MSRKKQLDRRNFIKHSVAGVVGTGVLAGTGVIDLRGENITPGNDPKIREFQTLGRTGFKVSDIGIGSSFLTNPRVVEFALDRGLNFIDTAEHYSGGDSERAIGEALKNRDRKSVFIATKVNLKFGGPSDKKSLKQRFMKSLERMQTDYADCLMIHMCTLEQVPHADFHAAVKELKAEGRVRFTGLSNHGLKQRIYGNMTRPMEDVLLAAIKDGRFDVVLFVYNFLQKEQGEKIIAACKKHNVGVTLMKTNPVNVYQRRKASLDKRKAQGKEISDYMKDRMAEYRVYLEKAEDFKKKYGLKSDVEVRAAATRFVLANPDVHSVCATIKSFDDVEAFAALSGGKLQSNEIGMLESYKSNMGHFYCRHACGECEPACPHNVPVNTIMRYNHYFEAQGLEKHAMMKYNRLTGARADLCRACEGTCVSSCPHKVPIQHLLTDAHLNLTLG